MQRFLRLSLFMCMLLSTVPSSAEIVLVTTSAARGPQLAAQLASQGRLIVSNSYSSLLEIPDDQPLFTSGFPSKIYRHVESFPTSIPNAVRVMVEIDAGVLVREALQDELRAFVESLGGREQWRSKILSRSHYDIPVEALARVLNHSLVKNYWFNRPGEPSLASAVPQIGVSGSKGPGYWP